MHYSKIEIKNFDDVSVELNKFNVIVGECASGKSNFIDAFKFLKGISENFYATVGKYGNKLLQNNKFKSKKPTSIKINISDSDYLKSIKYNDFRIYYKNIHYELVFNFKDNQCEILSENVKFDYEIYENDYNTSKLLSKNL